MGSQTPDLCKNIIFKNQIPFNFKLIIENTMYIYNVDDDLDSGLERKKHSGDEGMDRIELHLGLRNGRIVIAYL